MEKSVEKLHSSRIGAAEEDVLRYRPGSSCRSPVETKQVTTRATGERASTLTDICSVVDAAQKVGPGSEYRLGLARLLRQMTNVVLTTATTAGR